MTSRAFIRLCLKECIRLSWETSDYIAGVVGLVLGGVAYLVPAWEEKLVHSLLIVPLASLATVSLVRLLLSPFLVYKKRDAEARAAEEALRARHTQEELSARLGEFYADAADLRNEEIPSEAHFDAWLTRFGSWRDRTLDALYEFGLPAEYALFQNADACGGPPVRVGQAKWEADVHAYDIILSRHQDALRQILERRAASFR